MTNEIAKVFSSEKFGNVRVVMVDGEPWFVGKDICNAVGVAKSRDAVSRLDEDERMPFKVDTLGGLKKCLVLVRLVCILLL